MYKDRALSNGLQSITRTVTQRGETQLLGACISDLTHAHHQHHHHIILPSFSPQYTSCGILMMHLLNF